MCDKKYLHCAFIDYEKAFDTITRDACCINYFEIRVSSKRLKFKYQHVSSCVEVHSKF